MKFKTMLLATMLALSPFSIRAQSAAEQPPGADTQIEMQKFAFEKRIEMEKLHVERHKAWISGAAFMVPLMVAAITFALGIRNQAEQSRLQRESQEKSAIAQFELKAAEIVLSEKNPTALKNKAAALKALFPHRLPKDFVSQFDPKDFEGSHRGEGGLEPKLRFFEIAAENPEKAKELAALWGELFPGDTWVQRIKDMT